MAKHCKDPECPLPHYRIGKYRYCATSSATSKKKPKPIKPISDKQSSLLREYRKARDAYFKDHPICEYPECNSREIQLHHGKGRVGKLLTDTRYFKSLCDTHHKWVELHSVEAKQLGLSFNRLDK